MSPLEMFRQIRTVLAWVSAILLLERCNALVETAPGLCALGVRSKILVLEMLAFILLQFGEFHANHQEFLEIAVLA